MKNMFRDPADLIGAGGSHAPTSLDELPFDLLTAYQLAPVLGVGYQAVLSAAHRGEIPAMRVGSYIRFPKAALRRWIETGAVEVRLNAKV
jgi:excisionase family DNA binding protein